ncbi:hypothetical protein Hanom_Chr09g00844451 [Helianthus anomalus]
MPPCFISPSKTYKKLFKRSLLNLKQESMAKRTNSKFINHVTKLHTVVIQEICRCRQPNENRRDDSESRPEEQYYKKGPPQHFF